MLQGVPKIPTGPLSIARTFAMARKFENFYIYIESWSGHLDGIKKERTQRKMYGPGPSMTFTVCTCPKDITVAKTLNQRSTKMLQDVIKKKRIES